MKGPRNKPISSDCPFSFLKQFLGQDDSESLDENISYLHFEARELILRQGTFISQVVYLQSGIVKVVLEGENDRNSILKLVNKDNFIALPILGNHNIYPFSVVTITNSDVYLIRKEAILEILKNNLPLNSYLREWYSGDYQFIYKKINIMNSRNSHGKLATTLLYLLESNFNTDVLNIISRKELAELSWISLESCNKILMQLKHDQIITVDKKGIQVLRRDLIEKLSTVG